MSNYAIPQIISQFYNNNGNKKPPLKNHFFVQTMLNFLNKYHAIVKG